MEQLKRLIALLTCTALALSNAASQTDEGSNKVTCSIMSTMSSNQLLVQSETAAASSEPYFSKQWALYNDGTFTPESGNGSSDGNIDLTPPDAGSNNPTLAPAPNGNGFGFFNPGQRNGMYQPGGNHKFSRYSMMQGMITAVADIDLDAPEAWEVVGNTGREIIIAIIDTGIDYTNEELSSAIWTNAGETKGDGIDNDNNGYIDDVYGWDFYNNKAYEVTQSTSEYDHGTHVAGIIAAAQNGTGISGVAGNANIKLMSIKALGGKDGSGDTESVISAIQYAEAMGAEICNLSFGTEYNDSSLEATIAASDMLFVCAAGNASKSNQGDNTDTSPVYPASYGLDNIISVANLTYDGTLDTSSDYGVTSVDIAAPGAYILSTVSGDSYEYMTGTSMAAPMVTAVAAMVASYHQELTLSEVRNVVLSSAEPLSALTGKVATGGMVNAYNAVTMN